MGFPTQHLSKDFKQSSKVAGLVVETTVEQEHQKIQNAHADHANLTGAGEFAARGSINVTGAKLEVEKKKKDAEKALLQSALEQQHQNMLDQLNNRIGKLTKEIERDQLKLEAMRNKRSALDDLGKLVDAGKITRETPHNDVLDRAGIQDKKTFINSDKDAQKEIIKEEIVKLDPQIKELVGRIDSNMNKLTVLTEALDDLDAIDPDSPEAEAKMEKISAQLVDAGINIKGKSLDDALVMVEDEYDKGYKERKFVNKEFLELDASEQAAFIRHAEETGKLSEENLKDYKDMLKENPKLALEDGEKLQQQPIAPPAI